MTFTITFGWWLLPSVITIGLFTWANAQGPRSQRGGYGYGADISGLVYLAAAVIGSLVSWLIWAVLT